MAFRPPPYLRAVAVAVDVFVVAAASFVVVSFVTVAAAFVDVVAAVSVVAVDAGAFSVFGCCCC